MSNLITAEVFQDPYLLSKEGKKFEAAEQFTEAAQFFKRAFELQPTGYTASRYIHCMYKQGVLEAQEAAKFARSIYSDFKNNIHVIREYVWAIYYGYIKSKITTVEEDEHFQSDDNANLELKINAGRRILELTNDDLPRKRTVLAICKEAKLRRKWDIVYEFAQKIDPQILSLEQKSLGGKRLPSDQQLWFYAITRALLELERYDECVASAQDAIGKFPEDKFFHWWLASAEVKRGNIEQGLRQLEQINIKFPEWYIQRDIARVYVQLEKYEEAKIWFCKAANTPGDIKIKINMLTEMVNILECLEQWQAAFTHALLAWAIAAEQPNWQRLTEKNKSLAIELSNRYQHQLLMNGENPYSINDTPRISTLLKKSREYWNDIISGARQHSSGYISKLLQDKPVGFIRGTEADYFFKFRDFRGKSVPKVGMNVEFEIEKSFDQKKGRDSLAAINICPVSV